MWSGQLVQTGKSQNILKVGAATTQHHTTCSAHHKGTKYIHTSRTSTVVSPAAPARLPPGGEAHSCPLAWAEHHTAGKDCTPTHYYCIKTETITKPDMRTPTFLLRATFCPKPQNLSALLKRTTKWENPKTSTWGGTIFNIVTKRLVWGWQMEFFLLQTFFNYLWGMILLALFIQLERRNPPTTSQTNKKTITDMTDPRLWPACYAGGRWGRGLTHYSIYWIPNTTLNHIPVWEDGYTYPLQLHWAQWADKDRDPVAT